MTCPIITGQGDRVWAFISPEWIKIYVCIYSNSVSTHFLFFSTLCKAIVGGLGKNEVKSNLEKNTYVCIYVCMHMYLYIYIFYSAIYSQARTNIYFQRKWNPKLQKSINPLWLLIGSTSATDPLAHGLLSFIVNAQDGRCCASLTWPWMQAHQGCGGRAAAICGWSGHVAIVSVSTSVSSWAAFV